MPPLRRPPGNRGARERALRKPKGEVERLSDEDRLELKQNLLQLREQMTGQVTSLKNAGTPMRDAANNEEDGTDEYEREMALRLATTKTDDILAVDEALDRINNGSYGVCECCDDRIEKPRIKALPFVRTCITCQSEIEDGSR